MLAPNPNLLMLDGIKARRTVVSFEPEPVQREVLEEVLEYGVWAPNHHLTEPWRFIGIGEEAKVKLAERYRRIACGRCCRPHGPTILGSIWGA